MVSKPVSFRGLRRVSSRWPSFHRLVDGQKLPGNFKATLYLKKAGKMTGSIIGPDMAGQTGPFATAL